MSASLTEHVRAFLADPTPQEWAACYELARSLPVRSIDEAAVVLLNLDHLTFHLLRAGQQEAAEATAALGCAKALDSLAQGVEPAAALHWARRLWRAGLRQQALELLEQGVELTAHEPAPGEPTQGQPPRRALLMNLLGDLLRQAGAWGRAWQMLEAALSTVPANSPDRPSLQLRHTVLNNLGLVHGQRGDPGRAMKALLESVHLQDALGEAGPPLAITLDNLGSTYANFARKQGPLSSGEDWINEGAARPLRRAAECFARAASIFQSNLPASAHDLVVCLLNTASLELERGRLEEAGHALERAQEITAQHRLGGELAWSVTEWQMRLFLRQGRDTEALAAGRAMLETCPEPLPADERLSAILALLAAASARQGLAQEVWHFTQAAAAIDDALLRHRLHARSEQQALSILEPIAARAARLLGAALIWAHDAQRTAWLYDLLLRRKGLLLHRTAQLWREARRAPDGETRQLFEEVRRLRQQVALLNLDGGDVTLFEKARHRQAEAAGRLDDAEAMLSSRLTVEDPPGAQAVCAAMPADTLLVELAQIETPAGELRYLAFEVRNGEPVRARDVGAVTEIDAQIATFVAAASNPPHASTAPAPPGAAPEESTGRALRLAILGTGPLPPQVLISPVGAIAQLPFAALPGENGALVCGHAVSLLPTGRWLALAPASGETSSGDPVVMGNPDFDLGFDTDLPFSVRLRQVPLAAAEREARSVAAILGIAPLLGATATRGRFLDLKGPALVHLATHGTFLRALNSKEEMTQGRHFTGVMAGGVYLEEEPGSDYVMFEDTAEDAGLSPQEAQRRRAKARERWLARIGPSDRQTRSVLMFAGVNAWLSGAATGEETGCGMISAAELALVDLRGTLLVVLSGCETATGALDDVDGTVLGLRRSALLAGARASLSTLWKVDDEATAALMTAFYRHLHSGKGRAEALRQAQLDVRGQFPHPYFWAAPVLEGDFTALTERS